MQHYKRRCKHCGKTYTYCTYGNGPIYGTEDGCSIDFCSECQNAIDEALKIIPKRYDVRYTLLDDSKDKDISTIRIELNKAFDEERDIYNNKTQTRMISISKTIGDWGYKYIERCFIDGVEYFRCTKEDDTIEFKVAMEYDVINKKFTGDKYYDHNNPYRGYSPVIQTKFYPTDLVPVSPLAKPKGDIFI